MFVIPAPAISAALAFALACVETPAAAKAVRAPSPKHANWCQAAGAAAAGVGALVTGTGAIASTVGTAAVAHSSGAAILTSIGAGGTGYVAGTLGGAAATALSVVSAPAVIVTAATVGVAGVGTFAYCHYRDRNLQDKTSAARR